jgi:hypothetical protein
MGPGPQIFRLRSPQKNAACFAEDDDAYAEYDNAQPESRDGPCGWSEACGLGIFAVEFGDLDFAGEAETGEQPDAVEVGIDLVPP